jgi:glyoxylase-like metal-dependent hydrolase (beta-lactamase superfamily II)
MSPLRQAVCVLCALAAGAAGAHAQDPTAIVGRALAAIGGEAAVRALTSTAHDFHTVTFALGQEETPESPARATLAYGRATTDWSSHRRLLSQEFRTLTGAVVRQRRVTAGGIGMLETDGRQATDGPAAVAAAERAMRLSPERLLLSALANPGALSVLASRELRGERHDGVRMSLGPDTLELWFDQRTGLLTATDAASDDPILGDRHTMTWFTRYQALAGVKLPRQVDVTVNGRLQSHTVYTQVAANPTLDEGVFVIPDSIASRAQRPGAGAPPITVSLVELAPGVWRAEGGSHHSLVVEQPGQLVVVEAPQSNARTRAVLDTLRSRFPTKRVGLVVNTHHHWDHAGGLRTALAAGIPVATHGRNVGFARSIGTARKTVAPDELSRRPRMPVLRAVEDSLAVGEGPSQVVIYAMASAHAEGILAAYVPAARLLFTSDVLSPGATLSPAGSAEIVALVRARGLAVDRFAGGHGGVARWSEIEAAAAR